MIIIRNKNEINNQDDETYFPVETLEVNNTKHQSYLDQLNSIIPSEFSFKENIVTLCDVSVNSISSSISSCKKKVK